MLEPCNVGVSINNGVVVVIYHLTLQNRIYKEALGPSKLYRQTRPHSHIRSTQAVNMKLSAALCVVSFAKSVD